MTNPQPETLTAAKIGLDYSYSKRLLEKIAEAREQEERSGGGE